MNDRIKKVRRCLALTQQEFADRIGSKRNTVATYEMGRSTPSAAVISLICKTFNVNENWLRTGEGEMFIPSPATELDALAARYPAMTHETYVFVEKLVSLPKENQDIIMGFLRDVVEGFDDVAAPARVPQKMTDAEPVPGAEADAEALYENSLGFVRNTSSSALNTTEGMESTGTPA